MGDFSILATRIKELRKSLKMTQKEFSAFVGCTAATLSAYENGSKSPSLEIIKSIAERCHISIDWLCGLSNRQYIIEEAIWTYADVIEFCFSDKVHMPDASKSILDISTSFYEKMNAFLEELDHMKKLKHDELIDQELFDLWYEKTLKKFQIPIVLKYEHRDTRDAFSDTIYVTQYYPGGGKFTNEIPPSKKYND